MPEYIYIYTNPNENPKNRYKIGRTKNDPKQRLSGLSCGSSIDGYIVSTYKNPELAGCLS